MQRFVHILALLAVLVYSSPLCACLMQQMVASGGCHAESAQRSETACGSPTQSTEVSHDETASDEGACLCARPQNATDLIVADVSLHVLLPLDVPALFNIPAPLAVRLTDPPMPLPHSPPAECVLPLLV